MVVRIRFDLFSGNVGRRRSKCTDERVYLWIGGVADVRAERHRHRQMNSFSHVVRLFLMYDC